MKDKKIILTGGHFSPLLAVCESLKDKANVVVIGRRYTFESDESQSLEFKVLTDKKIKFYEIKTPRFQRKYSKNTILSFLKVPKAVIFAYRILKKEKPDAVLIFGGYIGIPVALAAYLNNIPIVVHEQTIKAGLANRIIGIFAAKICISYKSSSKYFDKKKTVLTGNPLRQEIFEVKDTFHFKNNKPILYVTGGSSGAHAINIIVEKLLKDLLLTFNIIHQTGDAREYNDYDRLRRLREELSDSLKEGYILKKFVMPEEIGWVYNNADVILSRAGINTISELLALSKKALLIPLPHGQKSEQTENAKMYKNSGLGTFIYQDEVTPAKVTNLIKKIWENDIIRQEQVKNDAANIISEIVLSLKNEN